MNMAKNPTVSIGMPVYNGAKYIIEALDSLLTQTYTDFELIISDNASTDETQSICEEYARKDKRIRYIRQNENMGAAKNFQVVLDESVGEYFMWAAHDDRRDKLFLELCMNVLNENEHVGLVFSYTIVKNLRTDEITFQRSGFNTYKNKTLKYLFRLSNPYPSIIYGLYRKNILKNIGIEIFDYFDIHLTHWFELNSNIVILPLFLYVAGTDGERMPYGMTGKYITYKQFVAHEYNLLFKKFSFIARFALISLTCLLYFKNTQKLNRKINLKKGTIK